jgi:hypothetical protein
MFNLWGWKMTSPVLPPEKCQQCVHMHGFRPNLRRVFCCAFINGLPLSVLNGEEIHDHPIDGDHGIQFQAIPDDFDPNPEPNDEVV